MKKEEDKDETKREVFSTRIKPDLIQELRLLAVGQRKKYNVLLEEGIELVLKKYRDKR